MNSNIIQQIDSRSKKRGLIEITLPYQLYTYLVITLLFLLSPLLLYSSLTNITRSLVFGIPNCQKDNSFCRPIIANAGSNQSVNGGMSVVLSGSAIDPDPNDKLSYYWKQIDGPDVILINNDTKNPSFMTPITSSYISLTFSLMVRDEQGATSSLSTVTINVKPESSNPTVGTPSYTSIPPGISELSMTPVAEGKNCTTDLSKRPNATEYLTVVLIDIPILLNK